MASSEILLTKEGLEKLEKELDFLKSVKRKQVASRIKEAISYGDIAENSEYENAKNEQAFVEGRIVTLEKILRHARIFEKSDHNNRYVALGSTVTIKDLDTGEDYRYTIVGTAEADPRANKISNESPVGSSILGMEVGQEVEVNVPGGIFRCKILGIS